MTRQAANAAATSSVARPPNRSSSPLCCAWSNDPSVSPCVWISPNSGASSRNTATGGTGLGLTLVKAIAEGHGGTIALENREHGGLRVRMTLPRIVAA